MTRTPASDRKDGMDALSDVLRVAHLTGGVFLHADFFAPWCMAARVAPEHCAPALGPVSHLILYHYVVEGELRIRVDGEDGEGLVLGAGDVVLLPRNDLHLVGSDLSLPPVAGSDIIQPPNERRVVLHPSRRRRPSHTDDLRIPRLRRRRRQSGDLDLAVAAKTQRRAGWSGGMDPLDLPIRGRGGRRWPSGFGDRAGKAVGAVVR